MDHKDIMRSFPNPEHALLADCSYRRPVLNESKTYVLSIISVIKWRSDQSEKIIHNLALYPFLRLLD